MTAPGVPIIVLMQTARNYDELREALAAFINDMLEREMKNAKEQVTGADMAVVLGMLHGKMESIGSDAKTGPYCPNPECTFTNGKGKRFRTALIAYETNYSGTGVDIMYCKRCARVYQVSYEVSNVMRIDPDSMEEVK